MKFRGDATITVGGLAMRVSYLAEDVPADTTTGIGRDTRLLQATLRLDAGYTLAVAPLPDPDSLMRDHDFWQQVRQAADAAREAPLAGEDEQYDDPAPASADDEHRRADDRERAAAARQ